VSLEPPRISYHMNRLQSLSAAEDYIVTLGGEDVVDPDRVIDRMDYSHPAYTPASVAAQRRLPELNTGVTAFAGAYHGWGPIRNCRRSGLARLNLCWFCAGSYISAALEQSARVCASNARHEQA
jgi:predicted NAD/FAD-binding protein